MARDFDQGNSEQAIYTGAPIDNLTTYTIGVWVRVPDTTTSGNDYFFSFPKDSNSNGVDFRQSGSTITADVIHNSGSGAPTLGAISTNEWTLVALSIDEGGGSQEGKSVVNSDSRTHNMSLSSGANASYGETVLGNFSSGYSAYWDGEIAEAFAYNVALSTAELDAMWDGRLSALAMRPADLVFYIDLKGNAWPEKDLTQTVSYSSGTEAAKTEHPLLTGPQDAIFIPAAAAVGGDTFNKSVAETFSFSDADSETADFVRSVAESLVLTDAATRTAVLMRSVDESLGLSDLTTGSTALLKVVLETLAFSDSASESAAFTRSVLDALGLADTATETAVLIRAVAETLVLTDAATGVGGEEQEVTAKKGGQSMTLRQMRNLERQQLLAQIRQDDEVILSLISEIMKNGKRLN